MRITDVCVVSPEFKQYRKAVTLAETINKRLQYHTKNSKGQIRHVHVQRAKNLLEDLATYTASRLDRDELKSNTPWGASMLRAPTREVVSWVFQGLPEPGPAQHDDLTAMIVNQMNELGRTQRAAQHQRTLAYEIAYRAQQGWFMIFNTLTVAPGEYYKVFSPKSTAFRDYIRDIDRKLAKATHGSVRNAQKAEDYHTYFAVVEEGAKNGRLHIHVVHLFANVPAGSEDPNKALAIPMRRELNTFKSNWRYGFSSPIMVRYAPNDAYGQLGYRWPYDLKTGGPKKVNSPIALASYMAKYITKSYISPKRTDTLWRVRKTQRLGRQLLTELLSTLTPPQLLAIASCPSLNTKLNNQKIPPAMLRQEALRSYQSGQCTADTSTTLQQMAKLLEPLPSLLHSSRDTTLTITTSNRQSIGLIRTNVQGDEATFEDAWAALKSAAQNIDKKYFRNSTHAYGTTSTRDHLYAASSASEQVSKPSSHNQRNHKNIGRQG